jgi:L-fucose isomerase-like protein
MPVPKRLDFAARAVRELERANKAEARRQLKNERRNDSYRKQTQAHGSRLAINLQAHEKAIIMYLQKCWGFESRTDTVRACLAAVAVMTRRGMKRMDLVIDPREDEEVLTR